MPDGVPNRALTTAGECDRYTRDHGMASTYRPSFARLMAHAAVARRARTWIAFVRARSALCSRPYALAARRELRCRGEGPARLLVGCRRGGDMRMQIEEPSGLAPARDHFGQGPRMMQSLQVHGMPTDVPRSDLHRRRRTRLTSFSPPLRRAALDAEHRPVSPRYPSLPEAVFTSVTLGTSGRARSMQRCALLGAVRPLRAGQLANWFGVSERTCNRRLDEGGLGSLRDVIRYSRAVRAVCTLVARKGSLAQVATGRRHEPGGALVELAPRTHPGAVRLR